MTLKPAFLFPGQGSQIRRHGTRAVRAFRYSPRSVFEEADDALGFASLETHLRGTRGGSCKLTEQTQPAILTVSVAMATALLLPNSSAGQNAFRPSPLRATLWGSTAAHVIAAGTISFRRCGKNGTESRGQLYAAGRALQEQGAMAAILGLPAECQVNDHLCPGRLMN